MSDIDTQQAEKGASKSRYARWMTYVLIFGVVMPLITLVVEISTHICAKNYFNPLPTLWHVLLFALIPVANLSAIITCLRGKSLWPSLVTTLSGASVAVSAVYSLLFIPMIPNSVAGILFWGIGFLGLSPFFAFAASIESSRRIRALDLLEPADQTKRSRMGFAFSLAFLLVYTTGVVVTAVGLNMMITDSDQTKARAASLVRRFGSEAELLRVAHGLKPSVYISDEKIRQIVPNMDYTASPGWSTTAQELYYRVTGFNYESVPAPRGSRAVTGYGTKDKITSSKLNVTIDPEGLVSHMEWTLEFASDSADRHITGAIIALPPGGVVSRVTLWENGKARDAAFVAPQTGSGRVVVSSAGPDRVFLLRYTSEGRTKITIGIAAPLTTDGVCTLPKFADYRFDIPKGFKHSLDIRSNNDIDFKSNDTGAQPRGQDHRRIVTSATNEELGGEKRCIMAMRKPVSRIWSPDTIGPAGECVAEMFAQVRPKLVEHVAVAVDGSGVMRPWRPELANALPNIPTSTFSMFLAADQVETLFKSTIQDIPASQLMNKKLLHVRCQGGVDNAPGLLRAVDESLRRKNGVVLWVHGPQPIGSEKAIAQILERIKRNPGKVKIFSFVVLDGEDRILAALDGTGAVHPIARRGTLADDMQAFFDYISGSDGLPTIFRTHAPLSKVAGATKSSEDISLLWAQSQVWDMTASGDAQKRKKATELAAKYRIVTPVSQAVVR